ncbi:tapasin-related protein-like [Heterodontus francisci]|uniref:tapasin-related protein-like n=1 Tax=Heterodontus francisci TaxID=7792 RepID=UPI00355BC5C4
MLKNKLALCLSALGIVYAVSADTSIEVVQLPESLASVQGSNVTFHCSLPSIQDNSQVSIDWSKEGDDKYLSTATDQRKVFGFINKFNAFLQIANVRFQDAGIYYCTVSYQGYTTRSHIGSNLTVWVPPTAVTIVSREPGRGSALSLTLVCQAAAFYPDVINFGWYKDGIEVTTGIYVIQQRNAGGLYEARSYLEETQPVQSGTVYICLVSHITFRTPLTVTHVITYPKAGNYLLISGCIGYSLICLLFFVLIWKRHQLKEM